MDIRPDCPVCLIEPNKFQAQITADLLRSCGAVKLTVYASPDNAFEGLRSNAANMIFAEFDEGMNGLAWTRAFRRDQSIACRKALVFLLTATLSRAVAEDCRHAGANAVIGKPTSVAALGGTIRKVLARPRPFIDAAGYVGPCRRAGIVTTHAQRRRQGDGSAEAA